MSADYHNQKGYLALIASMVFTLAFMIYISFFHPGVALDMNQEVKQEQAK